VVVAGNFHVAAATPFASNLFVSDVQRFGQKKMVRRNFNASIGSAASVGVPILDNF
jgi:hypothetical protein